MTAPGIGQAVEEAARFGAGPDGGVTRLAWEPALFDVYEWLRGRAAACGFDSRIDPAGNLVIAWTAGEEPAVAVVHLGEQRFVVPEGVVGIEADHARLHGRSKGGTVETRKLFDA